MTDIFVCCICSFCRYRHDVVALPKKLAPEAVDEWKKAIGEENYGRMLCQENPVACIEHFEATQFDAIGETEDWKAPKEIPREEKEFINNYYNDHGYSKLCKEKNEKVGGRINIEHVFCSICSTELPKKNMVQHSTKHCELELADLKNPCKQHQFKKAVVTNGRKSEEEQKIERGKTAYLEKVNNQMMANCSECISRHHRKQQEIIKAQALICFPIFTFKSVLDKTQSTMNTQIVGVISAEYMKNRFHLRGQMFRCPASEPIQEKQETNEKNSLKKSPTKNISKTLKPVVKPKTPTISYAKLVASVYGKPEQVKLKLGTSLKKPIVKAPVEAKHQSVAVKTPEKIPTIAEKVPTLKVPSIEMPLQSSPEKLKPSLPSQPLPVKSSAPVQFLPVKPPVPLQPSPEKSKLSLSSLPLPVKSSAPLHLSPVKPPVLPQSSPPKLPSPKFRNQPYFSMRRKHRPHFPAVLTIYPKRVPLRNIRCEPEPIVVERQLEIPTVTFQGLSSCSASTTTSHAPVKITTISEAPRQLVSDFQELDMHSKTGVQSPDKINNLTPIAKTSDKMNKKSPSQPSTSTVRVELMIKKITTPEKSPVKKTIPEKEVVQMHPRLEMLLKNRGNPPKKETLESLEDPNRPKKIKFTTPKKGKASAKIGRSEKQLQTFNGDNMEGDDYDNNWNRQELQIGGEEGGMEVVWMAGPLKLRKMIIERFSNKMHPSVQEMLNMADETGSKYRVVFDNYERLRKHYNVVCDKGDVCDRVKDYIEQEMYPAPKTIREDIRDLLDGEFEKHLKTGKNFTVGHVHLFAEMTGLHSKNIRTRFSTVRQRFHDDARRKSTVQKMLPLKKTLSEQDKQDIMMDEFLKDHFPNPKKYIELATHLNTSYEEVQRFYNTQRVRHINEIGMYDDVDILNKNNSEAIWAVARKPKVITYDERVRISLKLKISYNTVCYWVDSYVVQIQNQLNQMH